MDFSLIQKMLNGSNDEKFDFVINAIEGKVLQDDIILMIKNGEFWTFKEGMKDGERKKDFFDMMGVPSAAISLARTFLPQIEKLDVSALISDFMKKEGIFSLFVCKKHDAETGQNTVWYRLKFTGGDVLNTDKEGVKRIIFK